jgi:hypothetical protein
MERENEANVTHTSDWMHPSAHMPADSTIPSP